MMAERTRAPISSTYHTQSTKPPFLAMTAFTLSANFIAFSSGCFFMGGRYQTSATIAQLVITTSKYWIMLCFELFQNASPNHGLYCKIRNLFTGSNPGMKARIRQHFDNFTITKQPKRTMFLTTI